MRNKRSPAFWGLAILTLALITAITAGCQKVNKISSILEDPGRYMGDEVTVAGEVTKVRSFQLIIAEPGLYRIDDGSGTIWVITKHGVPREGAKVGLKGIVSSPIGILGDHYGAVIRETKRKVKD